MASSGQGLYYTQYQTPMTVPIKHYTFRTSEPPLLPTAKYMSPTPSDARQPLQPQQNRFDYPVSIQYPPTGLYNPSALNTSMVHLFPDYPRP